MKKLIFVLVVLGGIGHSGQLDLLQEELKQRVPLTRGLRAPEATETATLADGFQHLSGFSRLVERMGLREKGGTIIEDTITIEADTTIYGNITLVNNGQLIVRNCVLTFKGNIYTYGNSSCLIENADFIISQDFIYQYEFLLFDSSRVELNNSRFNSSNFPTSAGCINSSSFSMDSVDMDGAFITFCIWNSGSIDIRESDGAGEFVVLGDSGRLHIAHSDTVLIWLGFPRGSSGEVRGAPDIGDWVEKFTYPDSTCSGITYSIEVDSLCGLMVATMALDSTDVTVYDSDLRSCGNIFEIDVTDTISGLVNNALYDDWTAPFPGRNLRLVNSSARAWNLYFWGGTDLTLQSSIFGECLACDSNRTTIMQATCDGAGGHIGVHNSSFMAAIMSSFYTDALLEQNSISMFLLTNFVLGNLIARNTAISVIYNTLLCNPIMVYDSAAVIVTGLYPPSPAYVDDTLSIRGSAMIVRTPDAPFQFEAYRVEYAPADDTSQFYFLTDKITESVDDRELCKFGTHGLGVGDYVIQLWYFFSVGDVDDSLLFDNSVYLSHKLGVEEESGLGIEKPGLAIFPNPFSQSTAILYYLPAEAKVSLKIYDIAGRCLKTLVDEEKVSGRHEVDLYTEGVAAGIYFARLVAGEYKATKKLTILR